MKAIRMRIQKFSRPGVILLATVVAIITSMVVANATQTITTPNAVNIPFSLAAGTSSAAITPVTNEPVLVMGCCTTSGNTLVAQVSLLHIASAFIRWFGFESESPATITQGVAIVGGDHIVYIDTKHKVDIQTASVDTILIHNADTVTHGGNVTLIW